MSLTNGVMDGSETCVDGGGMMGRREGMLCGLYDPCGGALDCITNNCIDDGSSFHHQTCGPQHPETTCNDGNYASPETDMDCGGFSCRSIGNLCSDGLSCRENADCQSGFCYGPSSICVSCTNGQQDGEETGVDCGGGGCESCPDGGSCATDSDCTSGSCFSGRDAMGSFVSLTCISCFNGVQDGTETDVDCGGAQCGAGPHNIDYPPTRWP